MKRTEWNVCESEGERERQRLGKKDTNINFNNKRKLRSLKTVPHRYTEAKIHRMRDKKRK